MRQGRRSDAIKHEGFLRHARYRWAKIAVGLCLAATAGYFLIDAQPRHRGGNWYGYLLGTIGALLILWLTMFGVRKRVMTSGSWSLKAWLSAHVYLGLALLIIVTLHAGFHFGWNVHTLAYALMLLVIASGVFGVVSYVRLPRQLSENRGETTQRQLLESIRSLDAQLRDAAQPLDRAEAELVRASIERTNIGGRLWQRLTGVHNDCSTRRALAEIAQFKRTRSASKAAVFDQVEALLQRKSETLELARRHIRIRTTLEIWLYVHVPATFALLAALSAHIISVFVYW